MAMALRKIDPMDHLYRLQEDGCRICPYNRSHVIQSIRFVYHLMKCSKTSNKKYEICPYNAQHHVVEPFQMEDHIGKCESRDHVESLRYALAVEEGNAKQLLLQDQQKPTLPVPAHMESFVNCVEDSEDSFWNSWKDSNERGARVSGTAEDVIPCAVNNDPDETLLRIANEGHNELTKRHNLSNKRVTPAYAIEAERRLREEYLQCEDSLYQQASCAEQNVPDRPSWGRGRALGINPSDIPKPRQVPHQYACTFLKPANLDNARQDVTLPRNAQDRNASEESEECQPRNLTFLEECQGFVKRDISEVAKVVDPVIGYNAWADDLSLDASSAKDAPTIARARPLQSNCVLDDQDNFDQCGVDELIKQNGECDELSILKNLFYSTSLSSRPRVYAAFQRLVATIAEDVSLFEQK